MFFEKSFFALLVGYLLCICLMVILVSWLTKKALKRVNFAPFTKIDVFKCNISIWYFVKQFLDIFAIVIGLCVPFCILPSHPFVYKVVYTGVALILPCVFFVQILANKNSCIEFDGEYLHLRWSLLSDSINRRVNISEITSVELEKNRYVINIKDGAPLAFPRDFIYGFKGYNNILAMLNSRKNKNCC